MRDILREGENGRLLPVDDSREGYAAAIVDVMRDDERREAWSVAAWETAQEFDMEALSARLRGRYQSLKLLPRYILKKEMMTFGLVKSFIQTMWDELTQ